MTILPNTDTITGTTNANLFSFSILKESKHCYKIHAYIMLWEKNYEKLKKSKLKLRRSFSRSCKDDFDHFNDNGLRPMKFLVKTPRRHVELKEIMRS